MFLCLSVFLQYTGAGKLQILILDIRYSMYTTAGATSVNKSVPKVYK